MIDPKTLYSGDFQTACGRILALHVSRKPTDYCRSRAVVCQSIAIETLGAPIAHWLEHCTGGGLIMAEMAIILHGLATCNEGDAYGL